MFRSDKRNDKLASSEPIADKAQPSSTWQQAAPRPLEPTTLPPQVAAQSAAQPRAIGESDAMARDIKDGVLNGFVGNGTVVAGEASFKGMLRVDGHLTGRITSDDGTLLVGANGQVDANIKVAVATIHGTVNGDIVASKRIELGRSAKVVGNILTPALVIEQGAILEGGCRMLQPEKEKVSQPAATMLPSTSELSDIADVSEVAS